MLSRLKTAIVVYVAQFIKHLFEMHVLILANKPEQKEKRKKKNPGFQVHFTQNIYKTPVCH